MATSFERARIHHQMPKSQQLEGYGLTRNARGHIIEQFGNSGINHTPIAEAIEDIHGKEAQTRLEALRKTGKPSRKYVVYELGQEFTVVDRSTGAFIPPHRKYAHSHPERANLPPIE